MRLELPQRRHGDNTAIALISVVFIMLIFILLVGTLTPREARRVELARSASGEDSGRGISELVVDAQGILYAGGQVIAPEEIGPELFAPDQPAVALRADRAASAERILEVLAALDGAGIGEVRLVVRRTGG